MNTKEIEQNIAYHRHTQKPIQLLSKIVRNPLKNLWKTSIDFDKSSKKIFCYPKTNPLCKLCSDRGGWNWAGQSKVSLMIVWQTS
mgnify:CR=1 FL=1